MHRNYGYAFDRWIRSELLTVKISTACNLTFGVINAHFLHWACLITNLLNALNPKNVCHHMRRSMRIRIEIQKPNSNPIWYFTYGYNSFHIASKFTFNFHENLIWSVKRFKIITQIDMTKRKKRFDFHRIIQFLLGITHSIANVKGNCCCL